MKKIWEFFENMDECMYVADIDTHELIYMNKKYSIIRKQEPTADELILVCERKVKNVK